MPTETRQTFSALLRQHRQRRGLSFQALSRHAGLFGKISRSYLVRLEKGERSPSRQTILTLARTLDLPVEETDRLLASAGHPSVADREGALPLLESRAVRAVLDLLGDPGIPVRKKLQAEETLASYVRWLHAELSPSADQPRATRLPRKPAQARGRRS